MKNTQKIFNYFKKNTNWMDYKDTMDSFEQMAKLSEKMEKIATDYKKLYEMAKKELEKFT